MSILGFIFFLVAIYFALGLLFAIPFLTRWIRQLDEGSHGAGWGFKIIILPGTIVFWPVLLKKLFITFKREKK
jgi:hypothetical protein